MPFKSFKLNNGTLIPSIAYGSAATSADKPVKTSDLLMALDAGFVHIDTAQGYGNEVQVGEAIKASKLSRDELYITTKWSNPEYTPLQSITQSLKDLQLDHVDLYLIHQPRNCKGDIPGCWKQMEEILAKGLTKSIGVSNFTKSQLEEILRMCTTPPAANQIQLQPYGLVEKQPDLEVMEAQGIVVEGYSPNWPLRKGRQGPVTTVFREIGEKKGLSDSQVALAWCKAKGAVIVCNSSQESRLKEYLAVGDLDLSPQDVKAIDEAGAKGLPA